MRGDEPRREVGLPDGRTPDVKQIMLRLVLGLLVSCGCGKIPGQDVRYEPTPMPVVAHCWSWRRWARRTSSTISGPETGAS